MNLIAIHELTLEKNKCYDDFYMARKRYNEIENELYQAWIQWEIEHP